MKHSLGETQLKNRKDLLSEAITTKTKTGSKFLKQQNACSFYQRDIYILYVFDVEHTAKHDLLSADDDKTSHI